MLTLYWNCPTYTGAGIGGAYSQWTGWSMTPPERSPASATSPSHRAVASFLVGITVRVRVRVRVGVGVRVRVGVGVRVRVRVRARLGVDLDEVRVLDRERLVGPVGAGAVGDLERATHTGEHAAREALDLAHACEWTGTQTLRGSVRG